jgi:hypothetical protein
MVVLSSMTPPNSSIAVNYKRFLVECTAKEVEGASYSLAIADLASENDARDGGADQIRADVPRERSPLDLRN